MKKGFTLIELLAVIVILAVIALISVPLILGVIESSKKSSSVDSLYGYVDAIEYSNSMTDLNSTTYSNITSGDVNTINGLIKLKGTKPTSGTITIEKSKVTSADVCINGYQVLYDGTKGTVAGKCTAPTTYTVYTNGTAVYFNPVTGVKCTAGEAVSTTETKTGCMKWYAFNDGGASTNTINLILDHNTTALVAWNSTGSNVSGPTNVLTQLQTDTSSWAGVPTRTDSYSVSNGTATYTINYSTYKARLITASEIATITGNSSFVEATTPYTSWFYFDSNDYTQTATTTGASNYAWLFDYTNGCTSYGCNIDDESNYGYWTSTAIPDVPTIAWDVYRYGYLKNNDVGRVDRVGVRPVITILKSNL